VKTIPRKHLIAAWESSKLTWWFIETSWGYIVTKKLSSKFEFFLGLIPAYIGFMKLTYTNHIRTT